MNRYLRLLAIVLLAAVTVGVLSRFPRSAVRPGQPEPPAPLAELAIEVGDSTVTPFASTVPKDHRVRLTIHNAAARAHAVRLAGYEREVSIDTLGAGATWSGEFLAALPGDDFAWLVDGEPAGRLSVTGSHLVEGHR